MNKQSNNNTVHKPDFVFGKKNYVVMAILMFLTLKFIISEGLD